MVDPIVTPAPGSPEAVAAAAAAAAAPAPAPTELTFGEIQDGAVTALEAWKANPSSETFDAASAAATRAKGASEKAKTDAVEAAKVTEEAAKVTAAEAERNKPPEKYELKAPEKTLLTAAHVEDIAAFAKEQGLSQEKAQAVLERDNVILAKYVVDNSPGGATWTARITEQEAAALADPEIGAGNPETLAKNVELGKRVLAKYGDEEVVKEIENTGYGSNPGVIRLFARIGKAMGEDSLSPAGPAPTAKKPIEQVFYPDKEPATT